MAKFDGVKGYLLLEVEKKPDEVTLVFRDNRYLFVVSQGGQIDVSDDGVAGLELESVAEDGRRLECLFKGGRRFVVVSNGGTLTTDSIPE
jgi:hypothetical protein